MKFFALLGTVLLLAGCQAPVLQQTTQVPTESPSAMESEPDQAIDESLTKVLIDTDMSTDDLMAIAMLVKSPKVTVIGIVVTGLFVRCPAGEKIMLDFLATIDASEIPVACASTKSLTGSRAFPESWRDEASAAWGLRLDSSTELPYSNGGLALIEQIAKDRIDTWVVLGPLTSAAEALRAVPDLQTNVDQLLVMGGAVAAPGNVYVNGYDQPALAAEWNIYVDPIAADEVFGSSIPLVLIPLDATNQVPVTRQIVSNLKTRGSGKVVQLMVELLERYRLIDAFDSYFWDQLAVTYLLDPAVVTLENAKLSVTLDSGDQSGATRLDSQGSEVRYASAAFPEVFEKVLIESLSGASSR